MRRCACSRAKANTLLNIYKQAGLNLLSPDFSEIGGGSFLDLIRLGPFCRLAFCGGTCIDPQRYTKGFVLV